MARIAHRVGRRRRRPNRRERSAGAVRRALRRQRLPQQGVVGQGRRQGRWSSARCSRRSPTSARRCSSSAASTTSEALKGNIHSSQTGNLLSGAPLASGGEIRSGISVDQLLAQTLRPLDESAEPRAGLRDSRTRRSTRTTRCSTARTSRGLRRRRRRRWNSTRRWRSTACSKTKCSAATRACSMPCWPTPATCGARSAQSDQRKLDEYLDSVREVEQRIEQAGKQGELQGWRPTLDKPNIASPGRRHSAEHRRAHAADVRHPRARLPDRHDARQHAEAEQRSLVAAVPAPGRRLHDPPPAVALRHGRLAEGESVLRRATGVHRPQAGRDSRRRANGARQLDDPVLLEHDDGRPRQRRSCRS